MAWFGAMTIHVLAHAPKLLMRRSPGTDRVRAVLAGAGRRWLLLAGSLAVGLVLALATYHLAGRWTGFMTHLGG